MKIHPDHLESVRLDPTTQTSRGTQSSTAFGDILSQEVTKTGAQPTSSIASLPPPGGLGTLSALIGVQEVEATTPVTQAENAIMDKVDSVLDKWDQYAQSLQSTASSASLKQAYGVLDDIDGAMQQIRGANPDLAEKFPALQGVVSELEAMTVTERIKFNRGDYTA
ncbi:MAG: hypothetical protein Q8O35_08895 [Humidesulfovibrio sp.]|uniref:hypothetical protein n=1 Tax=Humidesulfovibrio sp. TaxID=2910988 RepID=UPI002736053C|nr:hypothetical protein [Humidesulfovibrio sp.]MDP2848296.1 hypothetical protein [Humidesulfovibrio sp.]